MREAWRWFGPDDPVSLEDIRQTGAADVVTALYHIPAHDVWPVDEIKALPSLIEEVPDTRSALKWSVVESIPVHEYIKLGKPGRDRHISAFIDSMKNLAACNIRTICYNFMPVIDATRTNLAYERPSGATALRFDQDQYTVFDLFILDREGARKDYSYKEIDAARAAFRQMTEAEKTTLARNITEGMPGKMTAAYGVEEFRQALAQYKGINKAALRKNLYHFLGQVLPEAEKLNVKLAIHPDDPPRDLFGLPRIICTADDLETLFAELPSASNGVTLCVGTFGSRPDNDLPAMVKQFGPRIHFAHLRGVKRDLDDPRSFYEASHLEGDVDMISIIRCLLHEESMRKPGSGAMDIPIRPDHGHQMMDDLDRKVNPGYSCIGRLRGLAEIRGVIRTLEKLGV